MVRAALFIVAIISMPNLAIAQNQLPHSSAEERACQADAHRFCRDVLADQFQVASCLQMNAARLHRACRAVVEGHDNM